MQPPEIRFEAFNKPLSIRDMLAFYSKMGTPLARKIVAIVLGAISVVCFLVIFFLILITGADGSFLAICLAVGLFLGGFGAYAALKGIRRAIRLQRLAAENGFGFSLNRPTIQYAGVIFTMGSDQQFLSVVDGTYQKLPFEFGNFYCTVGSGKNKRRRAFGVVEVKLKRKLPHILLDSRSNNFLGFSNLSQFSGNQQLTLEGNFNDYFDLFVPKGYERDALYVITPELMAMLIDFGAEYDIEIVDDRLFIYKNKAFDLEKQRTIEQIFQLISVLGAEFAENTNRYADAQIGNREANMVAAPGTRLKQSRVWLYCILLIIFGVIMFNVGLAFTT